MHRHPLVIKAAEAIANDLHLHGMDGGMPMAHAYDWLHEQWPNLNARPWFLMSLNNAKIAIKWLRSG